MKRMKQIISLLLLCVLCMQATAANVLPPAPELKGKEAILYCAENGQILYGKEIDTPAHPASITKLMTALLVLESGIDLSQTVTVSHDAVYSIDRRSTHIALDEGEQVTLEPMMYAMLLTSANDAANVLAEAVDGSLSAFAAHMTARAKELGCRHTNFVNANGLDDDLHYTTAYDMALITRALLDYDEFLTICGTRVYTMPATNKQAEPREFWNKQNILNPESKFYDPTAIAGKNGYTSQAGHTLVTVARRNGMTLIAVTMGSTESKYDKHRDTVALFKYGYDNFNKLTLTAEQLKKAAKNVGFSVKNRAFSPSILLLPQSMTADDITFSRQEDKLLADVGTDEPVEISLPEPTDTNTNAAASASASTVPDSPNQPTKYPLLNRWTIALGIGTGVVLVILLGLSYRMARIRRARARRRQRHRRNNYKR